MASLAATVVAIVGCAAAVAIAGGQAAQVSAGHVGGVGYVFPSVVMGAVWLIGDNLRIRRAYVAELEGKGRPGRGRPVGGGEAGDGVRAGEDRPRAP